MYYKELLKEATNERHQEDFNKKHESVVLQMTNFIYMIL